MYRILVRKDSKGYRVHRVLLDLRAVRVLLVLRVAKVFKVLLALKVVRVLLVLRVVKAYKELLVLREPLAHGLWPLV
jgi:hypothetical protein